MKRIFLLACTLFSLIGPSTMNATLHIDTTQCFKLYSARGWVYSDGTYLYGTDDEDLASSFAIINYNSEIYLYDWTNQAFVSHTSATPDNLGTTGNNLKETTTDFSNLVKGIKTVKKISQYKILDEYNNRLNIDGSKNACFNKYTTDDDGNMFAIIQDGTTFAASDAVDMLEDYFHPKYTVTYVVKNIGGTTLFTSDPVRSSAGATITTLPEEYQRPTFYSYNTVNVTINTLGNTNVVFTATPLDEPLVCYTANTQDPFYYKLKIRNKYIVYDESVTNELGLEDTEREPFNTYAQWAFIGEPYAGFRVVNQAKGVGYDLLYDELVTGNNGGTDYTNANILFVETADVGTDQRWIIEPNTGGFCMRAKENTNVYFHHQLISGESGYLRTCSISEWSAVHNDEGSTLVASVDEEYDIAIDATNFPDTYFREALADEFYDTNQDGYLSPSEIAEITELYLQGVTDFTGIEHLTALADLTLYECRDFVPSLVTTLTKLDISECNITSLDLSANTALKELALDNNAQLSSLTLPSSLEALTIKGNTALTTLDLSNSTALTGVTLQNMGLTSLDLSHNTALKTLHCYNNQLTSLDVTHNTALKTLHCYNNQLTSLDLSLNTALTTLHCYNNQLTSLDLSHNTALTSLSFSNNQLTSLDLSHNTALTYLSCYNNQLTSLDLSANTELTKLYCYGNRIGEAAMGDLVSSLPTASNGQFYVIDLTSETEQNVMSNAQANSAAEKGWKARTSQGELYYGYDNPNIAINAINFPDDKFRQFLLSQTYGEDDQLTADEIAGITEISVNGLSTISDLKGIEYFTALMALDCRSNKLTSLDLSHNTALKHLFCDDNQLTALDLSANTALTSLYCTDNKLTALDLSANTALASLDCGDNLLTSLNLPVNTTLTSLVCNNNLLTTLYVMNFTGLRWLDCSNNKISELNLSRNTALYSLDCSSNLLSTLDLSANVALGMNGTTYYPIDCSDNQLRSLILPSNCSTLRRLYCENNLLTELDLSGLTAPSYVYCYGNNIRGSKMTTMVNSLASTSYMKYLYVVSQDEDHFDNVITSSDVTIANGKGWKVYIHDGTEIGGTTEYAGTDSQMKIAIDETNFPDDNFRAYVASTAIDIDQDGYLDDDEAGVTTLNVSSKNIADLTGIEHFYALQTLNCKWNQLTSLDLENNKALTSLECGGNSIRYLELYENKALTTLKCSGNKLTYLYLRDNPLLETLECSGSSSFNQISELDFSKNPRLYSLQCDGNPLTELDLSGTRVRLLQCQRCQLTSLTLSGNEQVIDCYNNQLTELDLTPCTGVEEVNCSGNQLTSITFQNNDYLNILYCDNNKLESLDVSDLGLYTLSCNGNLLTTLDLSGQRNLTEISCYSNNIYGEGMQALVESLPTGDDQVYHYFNVIDTSDEGEGNIITLEQVAIAADKNWLVVDQDENPVEGVVEGSTEAYAVLSTDATTLTFYYDGLKDARPGTKFSLPWTTSYPGWTGSTDNTTITTVNFAPSFANYHGLTKTSYMFYKMTALTTINNLDRLNTENVTNMANMFEYCSSLVSLDVSHFNTENVKSMGYMFNECSALTSLDLSSFNTENVTSTAAMFRKCSKLKTLNISGWNTSKVTSTFAMFDNCQSLTTLDVSNWDTSKMENMSWMFNYCNSLTTLDVSNWNTSSVTSFYRMFWNCKKLETIDVSKWNTENVTNMYSTFSMCESLTALDVSNWKTDKVVTTASIFSGCQKLETIDVSKWNTANDTIMNAMFSGCISLKNLDVSKFNTSKVKNMRYMFNNCPLLTCLDLRSFNTSLVWTMDYMFYVCKALTTIYCNDDWYTSNLTTSTNMFNGCTALVGGDGTAYATALVKDATYAHVDADGNPGYFTFKVNVGDVNQDGSITIADVTALVNIILGKTTVYDAEVADVNGDGAVTIADVTALVNIILGK